MIVTSLNHSAQFDIKTPIRYDEHTLEERGELVSAATNKSYILIFLVLCLVYSFDLYASLSFEDRIAGQKAIESVYWKHRLWPDENKKPKPQFEEAVTAELIASKVDDSLRKSTALESIWKRPLLPAQLQAEMDRIAKETKDPKMLQELNGYQLR